MFTAFAAGHAKDNEQVTAEILAFVEPLKKEAWRVADKRIHESWRNAKASVQRRRTEKAK